MIQQDCSSKNIIEGVKSTLLQDDQDLMMSEDEIISYMDKLPPFSINKDNYFITEFHLIKELTEKQQMQNFKSA